MAENDDEASLILPYLYLGAEKHANNKDFLLKFGITYIINVTVECRNFFPELFTYGNFLLRDNNEEDIYETVEGAYNFIDNVKNRNGKVLVHCYLGMSRSVSVVIYYLMKSQSWPLKQALEFVKSKRIVANPSSGKILKLIELEQKIFNCTSLKRTDYDIYRTAEFSEPRMPITTTEPKKESDFSKFTLGIRVWDDEVNIDELQQLVLGYKLEGIEWGECKQIEISFGLKKLNVKCTLHKTASFNPETLAEELQIKFQEYIQVVDVIYSKG